MADAKDLFTGPPRVISAGSAIFAQALRDQGAAVTHLNWRPPAGGDPALIAALDRLSDRPDIDAANERAAKALIEAHPILVDVAPASAVVAGMDRHTILHAGPPVTWERMCGPMQGAVVGALIYEGLAADEAAARRLAASGQIRFAPNHEYGGVGPMAGVTSASSQVWVVENRTHGNRAFCNLNEGYGKVLRYGAFAPEVLERLRWLNTVYAGAVGRAVRRLGGIDLRSLIAQSLHMGDEVHNRNKAAGMLFMRAVAAALCAHSGLSGAELGRVVEFAGANEVFFVNLSMAACKAAADAAMGVNRSTVVVTMCRNGTDFGIRISGLPGRWFTAPAEYVKGLYFAGFGEQDAARDMGDSVVTETAGLGGFAMAAAPAIVQFVGGSVADAYAFTTEMYDVTVREHSYYTIPNLNFRGTPTGIDLRRVLETGRLPNINTGIAHKDAGVGQIGAGLVRPPAACFAAALLACAEAF